MFEHDNELDLAVRIASQSKIDAWAIERIARENSLLNQDEKAKAECPENLKTSKIYEDILACENEFRYIQGIYPWTLWKNTGYANSFSVWDIEM